MKRSRTPKLCKWKRKNRADQSYVELNGKRHYCGLWAVYNWFTEGFDTQDLIDAKALLEELA